MTRRLAIMAVLAAVVTAAALVRAPAVSPEPDFGGVLEPSAVTAASASVWYCPWINAGADRDASLALASATEVDASVTLPSPIPNEVPDTASISLVGPGSRIVDVGSIVRRGDAPGFVEFDDGPAAASAAVWSDGILTADRCTASVPKIWHLSGGTTREGRNVQLRLFNPFPDDVKVSVSGVSEFGAEPLPQFASIEVVGRGWTNLDLGREVPLLDDLGLIVTAIDGVVIPTLVLVGDEGRDEASWPGTGLSTTWYFPVAAFGGMTSTLSVTNPGAADTMVSVDVITRTGTVQTAAETVVASGQPARIDLRELATGGFGIKVTSPEPISAVVVTEDVAGEATEGTAEDPVEEPRRSRLAGTVGVDAPATTWLLPGAGGVPGTDASIWILNPSSEQLTVSLEPLGVRNLTVAKFIVAPATVRRYRVPDSVSVASYLVDAPMPIVVAWTIQTTDAAASAIGVPIDG